MAPRIAERAAETDAFQRQVCSVQRDFAVLVVVGETYEGVGFVALPLYVFGKGYKEVGQVDSCTYSAFKRSESVIETLVFAGEKSLGHFKQEASFDAQKFGSAKEIVVLVAYGAAQPKVSTGEEVLVLSRYRAYRHC